jgi:hypothetical protein
MIWQEMKGVFKNDIRIFALSVLAFTCACIAINVTLSNFLIADKLRSEADESYGNKAFHKIVVAGDQEIFQRVFSIENIPNLRAAFEQLKNDPLFQYRYATENCVEFLSFTDETWGVDDFPPYTPELLLGYEDGRPMIGDDYLTFKSFYVDPLFREEPFVNLSSGEWFTDEDFFFFLLDKKIRPVILGMEFAGL